MSEAAKAIASEVPYEHCLSQVLEMSTATKQGLF